MLNIPQIQMKIMESIQKVVTLCIQNVESTNLCGKGESVQPLHKKQCPLYISTYLWVSQNKNKSQQILKRSHASVPLEGL